MDFTREPIIETVITPREGYRLVVRSSKGAGSEEHFVDALEVVSFGSSVFFRCLERPKPFIVPVVDYEVLEVREPRMVLKTPSEQQSKASGQKQKAEAQKVEVQEGAQESPAKAERGGRRERRRGFRKRRGQSKEEARPEEGAPVEGEQASAQENAQQGAQKSAQLAESEVSVAVQAQEGDEQDQTLSTTPMLSSILPPPTKLIRDDLKRLREDYKGAFYINEEGEENQNSEEELSFRETPYEISEEDIRMNEGGDAEVPQEEPFREPPVKEEANSSSSQDVQKDL